MGVKAAEMFRRLGGLSFRGAERLRSPRREHKLLQWAVFVAYLLPATLVLLTLSIDLLGIIGFGSEPVVLFATGTA